MNLIQIQNSALILASMFLARIDPKETIIVFSKFIENPVWAFTREEIVGDLLKEEELKTKEINLALTTRNSIGYIQTTNRKGKMLFFLDEGTRSNLIMNIKSHKEKIFDEEIFN